MKNDAWKKQFHELWADYKEGVPYNRTVKEKFGSLLSVLEQMTAKLDKADRDAR